MCRFTIAHSGLDLAHLNTIGSTQGVAVITLSRFVVTLIFGVELTPIVRCNLRTFRLRYLVLPDFSAIPTPHF